MTNEFYITYLRKYVILHIYVNMFLLTKLTDTDQCHNLAIKCHHFIQKSEHQQNHFSV